MKKIYGVLAGALIMTGLAMADVRVAGPDALKAAVTKPTPAYSPIARQMKVAGRVEVEAIVDTDGSVQSVKVLTGNPMLTQSAVAAVQRWKFTPFTENGQPARAVAVLSFDFRP